MSYDPHEWPSAIDFFGDLYDALEDDQPIPVERLRAELEARGIDVPGTVAEAYRLIREHRRGAPEEE